MANWILSLALLAAIFYAANGGSQGKCGPPPGIPYATHGPEQDQQQYELDVMVDYSCIHGYYQYNDRGHPKAKCMLYNGNARWFGPDLKCSARSCGNPGELMNGIREGDLFEYPHMVKYRCVFGFELFGSAVRKCQANGSWSGKRPICNRRTDEDVTHSSPNSEITSIECNGRTASVQWGAASNTSSYLVEYRTDFNKTMWRTVITIEGDEALKIQRFETQMTLSPWVNYTFRVIAINTHGQVEMRHLDNKCNTKPSVPDKNPELVRAEGSAKDNLVIYWKPMEKEQWNGPGFGYAVSYRLVDDDTWEEAIINDPFRSSLTIRDTPTFTKYLVRVRSFNSIGESPVEPSPVTGFSGEDVPLTPQDFYSEVVNSTSVTFSWSHIAQADVKGLLRAYKVQTRPMVTGKIKYADMLVPPNSNSVTIGGFTPMQTYGAHVLVVNGKYESKPNSSTERFFTMPEGYPGEVAKLKVEAVGARTIAVHWEPPLKTLDVINNTLYETYVVHPVTHLIYDQAHSDLQYEVSISAKTAAGEGPRVSEKVKTWPIQSPGEPDMEIELVSSTSLRVQWIPSQNGLPGTSFYLNYSLVDEENWRHTNTFRYPRRVIQLWGFVSNENYRIVLVAQDEGLRTPSKTRYFPITLGEKKGAVRPDCMVWLLITIVCAVALNS